MQELSAASPCLLDVEAAGEGVEAGQGEREGRGNVVASTAQTRRLGMDFVLSHSLLPGKKIDAPALHRLNLVFTVY